MADTNASALVTQLADQLSPLLTSGEKILAIAVQNSINSPVKKDAAAVTNRRFIAFHPKLFGRMSFEDVLWQDVENIRVESQLLGATVRVEGRVKQRDGRMQAVQYAISGLIKKQALTLYAKAQEMEEQWREKGRIRTMEEERARAGGVVVGVDPRTGTGGSGDKGTVEERLARLKHLHATDLISDAEFESRKAQIIAEL